MNVSWEPSRSGNPGSVFYVQYRPRGEWVDIIPILFLMPIQEKDTTVPSSPALHGKNINRHQIIISHVVLLGLYHWSNGPHEVLNYEQSIVELDAGTVYQLRVVAKNGDGLEAPAQWQEFRTGGVGECVYRCFTKSYRYTLHICPIWCK